MSDESISWTVRLSDGSRWKLLVILAAAVTAGVVGIVMFGQLLLGLLGFAIILGATAEYWVGAKFKVNSRGADRTVGLSVNSMAWDEVKRVVVDGARVKLSPMAEEGRMDPFRGVVLDTTPENRDAVVEAVRRNCGSDVRFLEN